MNPAETTVAVVGAGPVGLVATIGLARRGIPVVLLDRAPGLRPEGSKAICVQRESLETLLRYGAAEDLLSRGVSWTVGRTYYRDHELFRLDLPMPGTDSLPPFVNISQQEVEQSLLACVAALPHAQVQWSRRVVGLSQDDEGVTLQLTGAGSETLRCKYVIGADGARSAVRELLAVGFPGRSSADSFLIADIQAELPFPSERRFFFDPTFNPGRQVLIHPQPDSVWRIDWQVPTGVDADEERRTGRMDARIRSIVGTAAYELRWLSSYQFHQRCADRYQVGRAFLAGDAAHLMAPFGARGMNSGIADADNLTWKLGLVLSGHSPLTLLASYEQERRSAALHNLQVTGATMRFLAPSSVRLRLRRELVLRGSRRVRPLRRLVDSGRLATPHVYDSSSIIKSTAEGLPTTGAVAPDAPCRVPGRPEVRRLRQVLGDVVTGLYLAPTAAAAQRVLAGQWDAPEVTHRLVVVLPAEPEGAAAPGVVVDVDGAVSRAYGGSDLLFVIRPDLHVASVRRQPGPGDWSAAAHAAVAAARP